MTISRPFRASRSLPLSPGRCPGLVYHAPSGLPQSGADIPVCAGLRGQAGMPATHCHAPSLRLAGTASPYLRLRASAEISPDTRPPATPADPHRPPSRLAVDGVDTSPTIGACDCQHRHCLLPLLYCHCLPPLPTATAYCYCLLLLPNATPLSPVPCPLSPHSWRPWRLGG